MTRNAHAIEIDLEKILPVLAKEIYNTPFAFLRENVQNAIDAVRIQAYRERQDAKHSPGHHIDVNVTGDSVSIRDSGIGMSRHDLEEHYWVIGKSGKHTTEAQAAGVVGTFGIGGMANFGVCSKVQIVSRTEFAAEAVQCDVRREDLSASRDCVFYSPGPLGFDRGTLVTATLLEPIDHNDAAKYLQRIVKFLEIPVRVNGELLSKTPFPTVDEERCSIQQVAVGEVKLRVFVAASGNGTAELSIDNMWIGGRAQADARGFLKTGTGGVNAYQHGFLLSQVPLSTAFGLEGDLDIASLKPTAGRESLTADSQKIATSTVSALEQALANTIATNAQLTDRFGAFFGYVGSRQQWELAANATVRQFGSEERVPLGSFRTASREGQQILIAKDGADRAFLETLRSQGKRIALLSSESRRQHVESQFLQKFCNAKIIEERIDCLRIIPASELSEGESALLAKVMAALRGNYFVDNVTLKAGELTHGAMVWASPKTSDVMVIVIDVKNAQVQRIINAATSPASAGLIDVFVRDSVFPHLEAAFPELRSRDFDMLLSRIQTTFEQFRVDPNDVNRLNLLAEATRMSPERIAHAVERASMGVAKATTVRVNDVFDVTKLVPASPTPARSSREASLRREDLLATLMTADVQGKVIDASSLPPGLGIEGYYLAMTPESHVLYRYVLERKPAADFLWGGHRAAYIFYDQGSHVLYYDIELRRLIEPDNQSPLKGRAGILTLNREVLLAKNMAFLPIPDGFTAYFVPTQAPLSFLIRHKVLGMDEVNSSALSAPGDASS